MVKEMGWFEFEMVLGASWKGGSRTGDVWEMIEEQNHGFR
jgi:hypothetical protein